VSIDEPGDQDGPCDVDRPARVAAEAEHAPAADEDVDRAKPT
jgi:hypothetical protein